MYISPVFLLLSGAVSRQVSNPYIWACGHLAGRYDWGSNRDAANGPEKSARLLCKMANYSDFTQKCLLQAVSNSTDRIRAYEDACSASPCELGADLSIPIGLAEKNEAADPDVDLKLSTAREIILDGHLDRIATVDPDQLHAAIETAYWLKKGDRISFWCGVSLLLYWSLILCGKLIWHTLFLIAPRSMASFSCTRCMRWLRAKILVPAVFSGKHSTLATLSRPIYARNLVLAHLPTRSLSIALVGFMILNLCILFTNHPKPILTNVIYEGSTTQLWKSIAVRSAFLALWKLPLVYLFAGRNNLMLFFHPWPLDTFNVLHKWIARLLTVDVIVHSIAISIVKQIQQEYSRLWSCIFWRTGVAATVIISLQVVQSLRCLTRWKYELFRFTHCGMSLAVILLTWFHVKDLPYGRSHILTACVFWGLDHILRIIRISLSGRIEAQLLHQSESMLLLKLQPTRYLYKLIGGGSYVYIHFPIGLYGVLVAESHPFTIVKCSATEEMLVCIKPKRGMTRRLLLSLNQGDTLRVLLDGPYGQSLPVFSFDSLVFMAGGIGITAPLSYISQLAELSIDKRPKSISLHWSVGVISDIQWILDFLSKYNDLISVFMYTEQVMGETTGNITVRNQSRLNCTCVIDSESSALKSCQSIAYFSCGPGSMNDDARKAVAGRIKDSPNYIEYFEESFHW